MPFLLLLLLFPIASSNTFDANDYLSRFGYMNTGGPMKGSALFDPNTAIKEFQRAYGLHTSGHLDAATIFLMKQNRCGVPDKGPHRSRRSLKTKWKKTELAYYIASYPPRSAHSYVDNSLLRALKEWEGASNLRFHSVKTQKEADIVFGFPSEYQHDAKCSSKFETGVLAHAFFPTNGQVHFNLKYHWDQEAHLIKIATHELGHALGLDHNTLNKRSIMYPMDVPEAVDITRQEIDDLSEAYGVPRNPVESGDDDYYQDYYDDDEKDDDEDDEDWLQPDREPNTCNGRGVDAVMRRRGEYLFFKGNWVWRFSRDTQTLIGPHHISTMFRNSQLSRIDAAIEVGDDAYFFSGSEVFMQRHTEENMRAMKLTDLGLKASDRITAAFSLKQSSGVTKYILADEKEQKFFYFDGNTRKAHAHSHWIDEHFKGAPEDADAAFAYGPQQDKVVFLKDGTAYVVDSGGRLVSGHPQPFSSLFLACRPGSSKQRRKGIRPRRHPNSTKRSSLFEHILSIAVFTILILRY